jgi:two-component sensor histidine kinase
VDIDEKGWIASRWARQSTGLKLLLFLSLALFPLGLIAILASIESAQQKNVERTEETLTRLVVKAQRINAALSRSAITISTASAAIAATAEGSQVCETTLRRLERGPVAARYALFAAGALRCASAGFAPAVPPRRGRAARTLLEISPDGETLRLTVLGERGAVEGIAEYSREALSRLTLLPRTNPSFDLALHQGGRRMVLRDQYDGRAFVHTVRGSEPVGGGQLRLDIALSALPVSAAETLTILLPVLMWVAAAIIGWLIADRLLLRPLVRMQRAVSAYRPGDREFDIPKVATPAREIGELGLAFHQVARTVARHEAELEAAVERQTRLVREVHHRVKNNLQVVASLLNLHSRSSPNEQVAAAYASIQRRVDALAVVHRNHFAELEENRGVALKSLISELAANLRATAPQSASNMVIRLDLEPFYVTQDVAVSVAFLITEIVEYAMFCGAASVMISLTGEAGDGAALLSVESDSLRRDMPCNELLTERFERIVTGLSRQLRSAPERDLEVGRYSLRVAVLEKGAGPG